MKQPDHDEVDALASVLSGYWNVEMASPLGAEKLRADIAASFIPAFASRFKSQLATALTSETVSPALLEAWTDIALDSQSEVQEELWTLWRLVYGSEEPT